MAKNDLTVNTASDFIRDYYFDKEDERRDMIAQLGVEHFRESAAENHGIGDAKETLAYTADVIWYLACGDKDRFVEDLFVAFNSSYYPQPQFAREWSRNPQFRTQNINTIIANDPRFMVKEGNNLVSLYPTGLPFTGFSGKYRDQVEPNSDQTHHFVAFVRFGHWYTPTFGTLANYGIELQNGLRNKNDIRLAKMGLKASLPGSDFWEKPGNWIRRNL